MLDGFIADEHNLLAVADLDERPTSIAQTDDHDPLPLCGEPADGFTRRGAVKRLDRLSVLQHYDFCITGFDPHRRDASVIEGRRKAMPLAIGELATATKRVDVVQVIEQVMVAADLQLRHQHAVVCAGGEAGIGAGYGSYGRGFPRRLAHD